MQVGNRVEAYEADADRLRAPRPRAQPATRPGFTVVFTLPLKVLAGLRRQLRRQGVAHRFIAEEGYLRGGLKRRVLYRFPTGFIFFRSKTKAGIQFFSGCLDSRIRGNDENLFRIGITADLAASRVPNHQPRTPHPKPPTSTRPPRSGQLSFDYTGVT